MRSIAAAFAVSVVVAVIGASARASTALSDGAGIRRCDAGDGTAIYTDKACGAFRAKPTPLSGELVTRIAMDARAEATTTLANASAGMANGAIGMYRDASEPLQLRLPGRRAPAAGCARSPTQLTQDLLGSFALGDVNRVAASYYWVGLNHRQALPVMKQLERLAAKPLADARFLAAWIGSGDLAASEVPTDAGLLHLVFADGGGVVDFEVRRHAGCYFIRF